ncbi:MAG: 3-phosphoshikimate 1-carboxyvinyltransferase, partial [Actinomyces sp.]
MSDTPADGPPRPWTAPTPLGPLDATVALPGSKSLTSRALLLAAVADGPTTITGVPPSRDTGLMVAALETLGARFNEAGGRSRLRAFPAPLPLHVATGPDGTGHVDCGLAGTVMRFVPPLAALADAPVVFDGDEAARRRPLGPLLDALAALGARTLCLAEPGHLPVRVEPGGGALLRPCDPAPGTPHRVGVDASESSQLLSALLLVGALLPGGLAVTPTGRVPSLPHVAMTVAALRERGIVVDEPEEPDATAAGSGGGRTWT